METAFDTAQRWIDFGVSPIPLGPHSKIPMIHWRNWTDKLPSIDLARQWFEPRFKRNIGLCCGMNNLVVIDFDNMDYYKSWYGGLKRVWKRTFDSTYQVNTARGIHFYFRTRELEQSRKLKEGVDIKACYSFVVAPPSIHPSGAIYTSNTRDVIRVDNTTDLFPYPVFDSKPAIVIPTEWDCPDEHKEILSIKDIKSKISIVEFVSGYTKLHKTSADGRWWMGRCPAITHRDSHPSFRVDTRSKRCTCLSGGCILFNQRGLDVFDFYQIMNGVDLKTAIRDLS